VDVEPGAARKRPLTDGIPPSAGKEYSMSTETKDREVEEKMWQAIRADRTVMLGLIGVEDGHCQPMTAQIDDETGHIWFFTANDTDLVKALGQRHGAVAHFAAKGHELFASIHGELIADKDRAVIDRLWNRFVAAWYKDGKDDPKLMLLRLEAERAQIWVNEDSVFAAVQLMLGRDPKKVYRDKVTEVGLRQ
jgi:general stress protein 26